MVSKTEQVATKGLIAGYAGKTQSDKLELGGFGFRTSQYQEGEEKYFDHWLRGARIGMGMEAAEGGDEQLGRQYAGGVLLSNEQLSELETSEQEIIDQLKGFIRELGDETRLFRNCGPVAHGKWVYEYEVLLWDSDLELVAAKETIKYKEQKVFVHIFQILPLKK